MTVSADDNPGRVELFLREGVPVGRNAAIELRNMHATYAATWYVSKDLPDPRARPSSALAAVTDELARTFAPDLCRFTLSAFTGFMFFRLMRRPAVITSSQYRKLKDL